jgi:3-hydroxyethyl bacteriochlorophyllide a dehydrogenase
MKSKAVVFSSPGSIELREVGLRPLSNEDVLIQTKWSSISAGTEKMLLDGHLPSMHMTSYPVIPGYETVGKIVECGQDVSKSYLDKYVYVSGSLGYTDVNAAFGGSSQFIVSPLHKVTLLDELPEPIVGIALPLGATAIHAVELADIKDKKVIVIGQGAVGLLVCEFARAFGAQCVVATDLNESRLSKSVADIKIDVSKTGLSDVLPTMDYDVIIDCSGSMKAIEDTLRYLKMHGSVVFGGYYERVDLKYEQIFMKELKLICAKQWAMGDLDRVRDFMAKELINFKAIFTHSASAWNDIASHYDTAFNDPSCLKMVLSWDN